MELENISDDTNMWGAINDFVEWSLEPTTPALFVIILLCERMIREWIAMRAKARTAKDHSHD